jgi:hypothetical protein
MPMTPIADVSADHVIRAYEGDSCVLAQSKVWPHDNAFMRAVLVRIAQRPVDAILRLAWKLYELTEDEFMKNVYSVWCDPKELVFTWTFERMLEYLTKTNPAWQAGDKDKWDNVQKLIPEWQKTPIPPQLLKPLIGYYVSPTCIRLEDGNTRMTAAHLASKFPKTVKIYIGHVPTVP